MSEGTVNNIRARLARPENGPWLEVRQRGPRPPELRAVTPIPTFDLLPECPPKQENGRRDYPEDFEEVCAAYPSRTGGNPKKAAYRAWRARVSDGTDAVELLEGVKRYARYVEAAGTEPRHVKQAQTFFGPDQRPGRVPRTRIRRGGPGGHKELPAPQHRRSLRNWRSQARGADGHERLRLSLRLHPGSRRPGPSNDHPPDPGAGQPVPRPGGDVGVAETQLERLGGLGLGEPMLLDREGRAVE